MGCCWGELGWGSVGGHLCCTLLCGHCKAVLVYMPEQYCCCVLEMPVKSGLFLAVHLQYGRLCHVPAPKLTFSQVAIAV
jgi:hypothetical protein